MPRTLTDVTITKPLRGLAMLVCLALPTCAQDLNTRLTDASRARDAAEVRKLLAEGADPNAKDKYGRTALMEAASGGYTENVRVLLGKGADVNAKDAVGWSALFRAAFSRRTDTVRLLLEKGADVKAKDKEGMTALLWASSLGNTDIVRLLLAKGADVNAQDSHGWTSLMSAADLGHPDTVRALLDKHASMQVHDKDGNTAQSLAEKYKYFVVVAVLKNAAQGLQDKPKNDSSVSTPAVPSRNSAAASVPAPGSKTAAGAPALPASAPTAPAPSKSEILNSKFLGAAEAGDTAEILGLIRDGAGVNARDSTYGTTALMRAAARGYTDIVRALLEKGGEVDAEDTAGHTALMEAAFGGYTNTVLLLIEKGADVNARDKDGWTPLFWATFSRRTDAARSLLEKGADVNAKNKQEDTALIRAAYGGDTDTVAVLLEHHPDLNAKDNMGRTALIEAAREERGEAVRLLLESGADVDLRDRDDNTALSLATKQHFSRIIAQLKNPPQKIKHKVASEATTPISDSQPANDPKSDPLAAEEQTLQRKSEARAFYGLGLSMSLLENLWPQKGHEAERAAAKVLGDLREVGGPEDLIDLAQQTFTRLGYTPNDRNGHVQPPISDLRKRLDAYCLAQTDEKFFYAAGRFTYELDLLGQNLSKRDAREAKIEDARRKLLPLATSFAAQCAAISECKARARSSFSDSAGILQKTALLSEDGTTLRKLSDDISVALGVEDR